MELRDYLRVLRKGWALILAFVVVGTGIGVGLTLATTKVYQADVQLFVSTSGAQDQSQLAQGNSYVQALVQSLTSYANSPQVTAPVVAEPAVRALGEGLTSDGLAARITADAPLNKVLINLHVTDGNPGNAAVLANAVSAQYIVVVQRNLQTDANGRPTVKLSVPHPARPPAAPIKPDKILDVGLGLVVGLLVGVGLAVLREVLDNTVKGPRDFEELGVAVLGLVPFDKRTPRSPVAFRSDPHSARSEAYRQLRTNMQFIDVDNPPRIIAITSAVPGEGKTTIAINLAAALAEAGSRVCLVEADLRRPSIAAALGLVGDVGFTTAVVGKAPVESVLQNAGRNLAVLTSGPLPPNPSELLISKHARQVILDLATNVDYLIIDTPPLLPVTDGAELATIADATLLVHRAGRTTRDQAGRSVQALVQVGRKPVGVILNMITRTGAKYDYGHAYHYAPYRPGRGSGRGAGHRAYGAGQAAAVPVDGVQPLDAADAPARDRTTAG